SPMPWSKCRLMAGDWLYPLPDQPALYPPSSPRPAPNTLSPSWNWAVERLGMETAKKVKAAVFRRCMEGWICVSQRWPITGGERGLRTASFGKVFTNAQGRSRSREGGIAPLISSLQESTDAPELRRGFL